MQPALDWEFRDEDRVKGPPEYRGSHFRRWRPLLVLALLVMGGGLGGRAWLAQREAEQAEAVRAIARLEDQARATGDRQLLLAFQDPALGKRALADLVFTAPPLQYLRPGSATASQVNAVGDWMRLDEIRSFSFDPTKAPQATSQNTTASDDASLYIGPSPIAFVMPRFYRWTAGGWLRGAPDRSFWGELAHWNGVRLTVNYGKRDAPAVLPLAGALDEYLARACLDWNCPDGQHYTITFSPDVSALDGLSQDRPAEEWSDTWPTPGLVAVPANSEAVQALAKGYMARILRNLAFDLAGRSPDLWTLPALQAIVHQSRVRLGLAAKVQQDSTARQVMLAGGWGPLSQNWLLNSGQPGATQSRSFVQYVSIQFGPVAESALLAGLGDSESPEDIIRFRLRAEPARFEAAWWASVMNGASEVTLPSAALTGIVHLPGPLTMLCGDTIRVTTEAQQSSLLEWPTSIDAYYPAPGGQYAVIGDHRNGLHLRLTLVRLSDGWQQTLANEFNADSFEGWSPDGQWLAFHRPDGMTIIQQIGRAASLQIQGKILWAKERIMPGGWRYARTRDDSLVSVADIAGNELQVSSGMPVDWSPDGRLAVLGWDPTNPGAGATRIQIIDPLTAQVSTILRSEDLSKLIGSYDGLAFTGGAWSPDGHRLAIVARLGMVPIADPQEYLLLVMDMDDGAVRQVYRRPWLAHPLWSPDSRYLTFDTSAPPWWHLQPPFPVGSGRQPQVFGSTAISDLAPRLTGVVAVDSREGWVIQGSNASWARDSSLLAVDQGSDGLILVRPDGQAMVRLSRSCHGPKWR